MTKETFELAVNSAGKQYIFQNVGELDKNDCDLTTGAVSQGRMYEQPGEPTCRVESFLKYLSKLNKGIPALWQRPLDSFNPNNESWYYKAPLGKNMLGTMMSKISRQGQLSQRYTNHSIRSTAITVLDEAGYEAGHIMAISGHKNEASIRSYSSNVSEDQSRDMSNALMLPMTNSADTVDTIPANESLTSPERSLALLDDIDIPSTPQLNQVMNTVLFPILSTSKDIFKNNTFEGCTININYCGQTLHE
ncbi:hypothetical protein AC249_AIPGENE19185 [Paramuricea clavata]|uniref:Uncharacterized protein n=1 Tax=Paramuricea clavata TaxID=317549 RepID=A0A7D9HGD1_PARCT|nr:hypothetical protein AC249_AIPGENE19185 [Paramuricea clavata]